MEFTKFTVEEFNFYFDTCLNKDMNFQEVVDNIESNGNNYFYVSMVKEDVVEAFNNEIEIAEQLGLSNILITEVGVYIALQP